MSTFAFVISWLLCLLLEPARVVSEGTEAPKNATRLILPRSLKDCQNKTLLKRMDFKKMGQSKSAMS